MDINLFDFNLPEELIAQTPAEKRDHSRLLAINKDNHTYEDKHFYDIIDYLNPGDVLVRNNTKVIPARLLGIKEITGAHCELLLLHQDEEKKDVWECLCKPAKSIKVGTKIDFGEGKLIAECIEVKDEGLRNFRFIYEGIFLEVLDALGKMPLPPYIKRQLCENDRYQTVYAKYEGSAAAPTAGFHFTEELNEKIKAKGIEIVEVTLHIGLGTFRPVNVEDTKDHVMHSEVYEMSEDSARRLNEAKANKRRIIAVGTTSAPRSCGGRTGYAGGEPSSERGPRGPDLPSASACRPDAGQSAPAPDVPRTQAQYPGLAWSPGGRVLAVHEGIRLAFS